jgi:hypothetical protein
VKDKLKMLRVERTKLQRKVITDEETASAGLAEYARADCRQLCDAMYRTLPREIRDMIYGFIHGESSMQIFDRPCDWCTGSGPYESYFDFSSEAHWRLNRESHDHDHLWNMECLGHNVFLELLQHYYRSTQFRFGTDYELLPRFLFTDQWGLGTIPADFVANVVVEIIYDPGVDYNVSRANARKYHDIDVCPWTGEPRRAPHPPELPSAQPRVKLLSGLQRLFSLKVGTRISIEMRCSGIELDGREALTYARDTIIPIIFTTLQRLHQGGYVVEVALDGWHMCWHCPDSERFLFDGGLPTLEAWGEKFKEVSCQARHRSSKILMCVV